MNQRINMRQWAQGIIDAPDRQAIPIMTHPGIEQIGHSVREAVCSGEIHAAAIVVLNKFYPAAAATVIMDLTVEAEAFGAEVSFAEHEVPTVVGRLVYDQESVAALPVPPLTAGRVGEYLKANRIAHEAIEGKPVFAGMIGPFSLAGRLFDLSELMMAIYVDTPTAELLLEKCTQFLIQYAQALKDAGTNGVILAEPAAGLLSDEDCARYSSRYVKRIVEAVQDDTFMVVLHNCGNTGHCTQAMLQAGAAALHFGNKIDMRSVLEECPGEMLIMGNMDPVALFRQASAQEVQTAATDLLNNTAAHKNFVLSTGCDIPPGVPAENIEAFYEALKHYNDQAK